MIKYIVEEEFLTCLMCDIVSMKSETVSRTELFQRAKQMNKNLQLEDDKILDLITESKASEYKLEELKLNVKYYISGYPYRFTWNLSQSSTEEFMKFFTAPLLCSLKSYHETNEELKDLLKKKDEEIAGYKLSGAVLVRKHLETAPFDPQSFAKEQDFSFVENQSVTGIYNLCGVSRVPESLKANETSRKVTKSNSAQTSQNSTKISPRRSRMMQNLKRQQHDDKLLYDDGGSSQETQEIPRNDTEMEGKADTPEVNPKSRKRLNL
uniref:Non-homologous end-joining factor 1 n=1 Tax=Phlebotomus kandelakii TaxID=1109342 RepID=A0A6B2EHS3_9DIPT